jgi:hypothetical protein
MSAMINQPTNRDSRQSSDSTQPAVRLYLNNYCRSVPYVLASSSIIPCADTLHNRSCLWPCDFVIAVGGCVTVRLRLRNETFHGSPLDFEAICGDSSGSISVTLNLESFMVHIKVKVKVKVRAFGLSASCLSHRDRVSVSRGKALVEAESYRSSRSCGPYRSRL